MTTETRLEPLPWFAFNVAEYLKDTMRLATESHGAYLLLMLDYYGTATPCPDDDFVLAAVAKLSPEAWAKHRKVLAPFFDIREGHWFHKRIERELRQACEKHAASIAAAKAGAAARWGKEDAKPARSTAPTHPRTAKGKKNAGRNASAVPTAMPEAMPTQCDSDAHKHKHPLITEGGEAPPPPEAADADQEVTFIPKDFLPSPETSDHARAAGLSVADIDAEVRKFIGTQQHNGAMSHDWQGSFAIWIEREIKHRAKQAAKAPPRIEVNARSEPDAAAIDRQVSFYARGGAWSHKSFGPEPGMRGCRIDPKVLEQYGIDPTTGMRKAS